MSGTWDDPTTTLSYNDGGLDSGYVDSGTFNNGSTVGGGTNWSGIAKALQGATGGQQQAQHPAVSNLPGVSGSSPAGQAQSGAYSGNASGMNALAQMLMARVQALREASNPRGASPVNLQSQQRPQGLLGL